VNICDGRQTCSWEEARLNGIFIDFNGICTDPYVSIRYTCIEDEPICAKDFEWFGVDKEPLTCDDVVVDYFEAITDDPKEEEYILIADDFAQARNCIYESAEEDIRRREGELSHRNCRECGCKQNFHEGPRLKDEKVSTANSDIKTKKAPVIICEHAYMAETNHEHGHFHCKHNEVIEIEEAIFGMPDGYKPHCSLQGENVACFSEKDVTSIYKNTCDGQKKCFLRGSNEMKNPQGIAFDPCPGVHKYTKVDYNCLSNITESDKKESIKSEINQFVTKSMMIAALVFGIFALLVALDLIFLCCKKKQGGLTYITLQYFGFETTRYRFFVDTEDDNSSVNTEKFEIEKPPINDDFSIDADN